MIRSDCYSAYSYPKQKIPISLFLFRFQIKTPIAFLLPRTKFDRPKQLVQDKANKIHDSNKSELKMVSTFAFINSCRCFCVSATLREATNSSITSVGPHVTTRLTLDGLP
jgi:hypothetical protein